jgi:hypothetical protein
MEAKSIRVFYRSLLEGKLVKNSMLYGISGNRSTGTYDCKETQIITPNQEILTEKIWVANMNAGVLSELGSAESNRRAAVTVRPGQTLVLGFFVSNENVVLSELYNSPKSTVRPYSAMMAQSCHAACTGPLNAELTACAPSPAEPYCAEYLTQCRDRCKNQGDPSCSACAITESLAARTDNRYRSRCSGSWFAKVVNIEGKTGPLDVGIQLEFLPAMKSISIGYELTTSSDTHVDYDFSELLKPSTWDF